MPRDEAEVFKSSVQELEHALRAGQSAAGKRSIRYLQRHLPRYAADYQLLQHNRGRIVEIGSYPYHMTFLLSKAGHHIQGVDVDPARNKQFLINNNLNVIKANIDNERIPLPSNSADIVLFNEILEHLTDPIHALLEANRILKKNGKIILTTPNVYHLPRICMYLCGRGPLPDAYEELSRKYWYGSPGHLREYTRAELMKMLHATNFRTITHKYRQFGNTTLQRMRGGLIIDAILRIISQFKPYHLLIATKDTRRAAIISSLTKPPQTTQHTRSMTIHRKHKK